MTSSTSNNAGGRPYYEGDVDFDKLAAGDPDFAAIVKVAKEQRKIDFQDPEVLLGLTKAILKSDFNLTLTLPPDRLCPPIPVRWNYIHWIQELLDTTSPNYTETYDPNRPVTGLDIGVGASCIYPLLACSTRPKWRMAGSDIDQHSLDWARKNVLANDLFDRIRLARTTEDGPLIPLEAMKLEHLDFTMTNPPFYSSKEDMQTSYTRKSAPPSAICTGSINEMICEGGEVGFVSRIIDESLVLRKKVQWYTAMIGRLPSLHQIVARLKEEKITNFAVTSLQAGYKTNRWAVAWSFGDLRPRNNVARHGQLVLAVLPSPTAQTVVAPLMSKEVVGRRVDETMEELDVRWQWREKISTGVVEAKENVWSRAARRKRKFVLEADVEGRMGDDGMGDAEEESEDEVVGLAGKIACEDGKVDIRWLRGTDYVLFTSFCGMLKTALSTSKQ